MPGLRVGADAIWRAQGDAAGELLQDYVVRGRHWEDGSVSHARVVRALLTAQSSAWAFLSLGPQSSVAVCSREKAKTAASVERASLGIPTNCCTFQGS